jgi:hypothetical protein
MLYVINRSSVVSNLDVETMTRACALQLSRHVAPSWGRVPVPVVYSEHAETAAPGAVVIYVTDTTDVKGALGYHTEAAGDLETGIIAAGPVLDNGGDALSAQLSVASVLSHEVCEWFIDPKCNLTADTGRGYSVMYEVADPVESDSYPVPIVARGASSATQVTVSNFVLPAWFDPQAATSEQLDYLGTCSAPFEITSGGYVVRIKEGKVSQVFGESFPKWREPMKDLPRYRRLLSLAGDSRSA